MEIDHLINLQEVGDDQSVHPSTETCNCRCVLRELACFVEEAQCYQRFLLTLTLMTIIARRLRPAQRTHKVLEPSNDFWTFFSCMTVLITTCWSGCHWFASSQAYPGNCGEAPSLFFSSCQVCASPFLSPCLNTAQALATPTL